MSLPDWINKLAMEVDEAAKAGAAAARSADEPRPQVPCVLCGQSFPFENPLPNFLPLMAPIWGVCKACVERIGEEGIANTFMIGQRVTKCVSAAVERILNGMEAAHRDCLQQLTMLHARAIDGAIEGRERMIRDQAARIKELRRWMRRLLWMTGALAAVLIGEIIL